MHLLAGEPVIQDQQATPAQAGAGEMTSLQEEVEQLRSELDALRKEFQKFKLQFD